MSHSILSVSILNADFSNLQKVIATINQSQADWFHLDIMDGVYVPNISFGFPVVEIIRKHTSKPLDVHLMIVHPEVYIERFREAGADILTVHYEACTHLHRTIQQIKGTGMKAGVALNPHTPVEVLEDILQDLDLVLLMTVNPGYGGQVYIENSYKKAERLARMIRQREINTIIQVDGGIEPGNMAKLIPIGVSSFVVGSYIFRSDDALSTIASLKAI